MADDINWTERDLLLATASFLRDLTNHLAAVGVISPDQLRQMVEHSSAQLTKEGSPNAAHAVSFLFQMAKTGELDQKIRLLGDSEGSA